MEGDATVNDQRGAGHHGHVVVHLLVHQPEGDGLVAHQCLVVALRVGDAGLRPAPVGQRVGDVAHVPVLILGGLQQLRQKK